MKRNIPLLVFSTILSVIALAIAIPTIDALGVRGIDPGDVDLNFITPYFTFQPSTDLQGGKLITLNVELTGTDNISQSDELELIKSSIYFRFWNARIENFSLNVITDNSQNNKIVIKAPSTITEDTMNLLLRPGNFSVWVEDPNATDEVEEGSMESLIRQIFGKRFQLGIINSDVTSIGLVSDSRCYFGDPSAPSNYCILIKFNEVAQNELATALTALTMPDPQTPVMVALDYSPVGVMATGQTFYNATSVGSELLVYTGLDDPLYNNILASMISSQPLNASVSVESVKDLGPIMGADALLKIKIALALSVIAANALIIYYFKRRGVVFTLSFALFLIWSIALMKLTNMTLSFGLISGFVVASLLYISVLISSEYNIRTAFKGHLTVDELDQIYSGITSKVRNITFAVVAIDFVAGYYATALVITFMTGLGVGMIGALLVTITIFKAILPFLLLSKKA